MDRARAYKPLLVLAIVLGLVFSGFMQNRLDKKRADLGLTRLAPLENAPPMLAFTTVALGGFRGLIANALWVRAVEMQDDGQYFEMVQLADWITKLQPHIPTVWIAQAWNMSYNISVKFQNPKDRWLWVQRGITLLRDEAIKYNPKEPQLYRELAWQFQHKMGANLDDAHLYYKMSWASEMTQVLGGGRPNFEELIHPQNTNAMARAKLLREHYKMDPAVMKQADDAYGPLDWRLPEAHAIYWAWYGLSKSKDEELIKLRRVIYQCMQLSFQRGRLLESRTGLIYNGRNPFGPNLDIIPNVNKSYEDMMIQDPGQTNQIRTAHRNFLRDAVYFLFTNQRISEAQRWYKYLGQKYPDNDLLPEPGSLPSKIDLDTYALSRTSEDINETSVDRITAMLRGYIVNYYLDRAAGYDERAANYKNMSQRIYKRYAKAIETQEKRVGLNSLPELHKEVLNYLLGTNSPLDAERINELRTELRLPANTTEVDSTVAETNAVLGSFRMLGVTNAPAAGPKK
jgi:hypothetical protein